MKTRVLKAYKFENGESQLVWEAPFKDEDSFIKTFVSLSSRGFYCQVTEATI